MNKKGVIIESKCDKIYHNIIQKNRKLVEGWSEEKKRLHFWYWCGVTDFGEDEKHLSPYSTELIEKFDKRCGA